MLTSNNLLNSIIQIGPEVLNNMTNITPQSPPPQPFFDYGFLQAAVTFLAGLLIFLSIGRKFNLFVWTQQKGSDLLKRYLDEDGFFLFALFISAGITVVLSVSIETVFIAKFFMTSSIGLLIIVLYKILTRPLLPSD
jgi:hypothetical protein